MISTVASTGAGLGLKIPLLSNPWTAAALGIAELAPTLKNALGIGTAHLKANEFTKYQTPMGNEIIDLIKQYNQTQDPSIIQQVSNKWNELSTLGQSFAAQGGDQAKVWKQAQDTLKFIPGFLKDTGFTGTSSGASGTNAGDSNNFDFNNLNLGNFDFGNFINSLTSDKSGGNMGFDLGSLIRAIPSLAGINKNNTAGGNSSNASIPDWMKYLLPGLAGIGGGLSNRPATSTTTVSPTNLTSSSISTSTPNLDPGATGLRSNIIDQYMTLLNQDPNLKGYESSQLSDINRGYGAQATNLEGNLAARGITGPAAATSMQNLENQRFGAGINLRNQIPLLARGLKEDTLSKALTGFSGLVPSYGSTGTSGGTQSSSGVTTTGTKSGNIAGGAFSGASQALALLLGMGAFNRPT